MADQSYDLRDTSKKVKNRMWWKNKKVMIGIIAVIVIVVVVVVIVIVIVWHNVSQLSVETKFQREHQIGTRPVVNLMKLLC